MNLDKKKVQDTIGSLSLRIHDRFPKSGLYGVSRQLQAIAKETEVVVGRIKNPIMGIRLIAVALMLAFVLAIPVLLVNPDVEENLSVFSLIQTLEAGANLLILMGLAVVFFWTLELRIRRRRVVGAINRLRDIAHTVDMKQLTKDPDGVLKTGKPTAHSPKRLMSAYELGRYLDYCSEMLSLISKLGYLYTEDFNDPEATRAVNELENFCTGLSRKVWQKIMILRTLSHLDTAGTGQGD